EPRFGSTENCRTNRPVRVNSTISLGTLGSWLTAGSALATSRSPFGAKISPRGPCRCAASPYTTVPVPRFDLVFPALWSAKIVSSISEATKRVSRNWSYASPAGPTTTAAVSGPKPYPEPIVTAFRTETPPWSKVTSRRVIGPSKTLETNSCAKEPWSLIAIPHGPLMSSGMPRFVTTWLLASKTYSPPDLAVFEVPSVVSTEPAKTNPARTRPRALVNPIGGVPSKNGPVFPLRGSMVMIVLPRPWRLVLLKFEISISPGVKMPPGGKSGGTNARPYGVKSRLGGGVGARRGRDGWWCFVRGP